LTTILIGIFASYHYSLKQFLYILILFISIQCIGQQYEAYKINYGVNEGLPSSECYEIIQDSKGYIWFGTDRGVVKYNGYEFQVFTTKEGLNNNVVFYLAEGPDGKIWFYDIENQLSYYYKDSIYQFNHNAIIKENIPKQAKPIGIKIGQNETIYFSIGLSDNDKTIRSIEQNGKVSYYDSESYDLIFEKPNKRITMAYFGFNKEKKRLKQNFTVQYSNKNNSFTKKFSFIQQFYVSINRFKSFHDKIYFSYFNQLFVIDYKNEIKKICEFDKGIIEIDVDEQENVYIGLYDQGMMVLPKGKPEGLYALVSDCSVSGFYKDVNGGMWLSTQDKGIYFLPHKSFSQHIPTKDVLVNNISGIGNDIIYSNYAGELYQLNNGKKLPLALKNTTYIRNIVPLDSSRFMTSLISTYKYIYDDIDSQPSLTPGAGLDWLLTDSLIYGVSYGSLTSYDKIKLSAIDSTELSKLKLECLAGSFSGKELFFGTVEGLYSYDFTNYKKKFPEFSIYNSRISDMIMNKGILYSATRGEGLIVHTKGKAPYTLSKKDGLISNELHKIALFGNRIYVLSKEGLSILEYKLGELKVANYSSNNGLLSNEVNDVYERNDTVWVATNKGITKFHISESDQIELDCPIYLKSLSIKNIEKDKNQILELKYNENDLEFAFEAVSFNNNGNIKYRYKLVGIDEKWKETVSRELRYPNLPPGSYKFIISYQKPDLTWSSPTTLFKMKIKVPIWEQTWFIIGVIVSGILFVFIIVSRFVYKANREIQVQKTILDLERKALQAQMNPHFIFNALTSIQSLIAQKKNENAEEFLVTFSRLVRASLNHSSQAFISLEEELKLLKDYLKIEGLRFEQVFNWDIELSKSLSDEDIFIPPMLIQPFIENAIEHGIRPLGRPGELSISISYLNNELLEVRIEDDGVGRSRAQQKQIKGRESKGIGLVKDRLHILNKNASVLITDKDRELEDCGTVVVLKIPYQNRGE